jgi:hypothetical protein
LRSPEADLAVLYFTAGGQAGIKPRSLAKELSARWYNPRNGKWADADKTGAGVFVTPDAEDWVLLLQKPQESKQTNVK